MGDLGNFLTMRWNSKQWSLQQPRAALMEKSCSDKVESISAVECAPMGTGSKTSACGLLNHRHTYGNF
ncbi:hypothetical protein ACTXT7_012911 [Hymenolepis weldensis]